MSYSMLGQLCTAAGRMKKLALSYVLFIQHQYGAIVQLYTELCKIFIEFSSLTTEECIQTFAIIDHMSGI